MLGLTDTMSFLKSLSGLVENDTRTPEKQPRERAAASVLFDWEVYSSVSNIPSGFL
jgi:L-arabinokinase